MVYRGLAMTFLLLAVVGCGRAASGHVDQSRGSGVISGVTATSPPATTMPAPFQTPGILAAPTVLPTSIVGQVAEDPAVKRLIAALEQRGIAPLPVGPSMIRVPTAPGQACRFTDDIARERLYLHVYPNEAAAQSAAKQLLPTGSNGLSDWPDLPHFFRCGGMIALYLGQQRPILDLLTERCGPQFAGQP